MAIVSYDGKALIPAPVVTVQKTQVQTGGEKLDGLLTITLRGKLVAFKGSPLADGSFWTASDYPPDDAVDADERLAAILRKQSAIRSLFATDGKLLELQPLDGSQTTKFRPTVKEVSFSEGVWFDVCDYQVTLEAPASEESGAGVSECSDQWEMESDEKEVEYRLSRVCSARGRPTYDDAGNLLERGWEVARAYVLDQIGLGLNPDRMEAPDVLDASTLQAFNHLRKVSLDEKNGTFSVTESWTCFDPQGGPAAVDEYTVNVRTDESGRVTVGIDGNIRGLQVRDESLLITSTRYESAQEKWDVVFPHLHTRCQSVAGVSLNPNELSLQVGRNPTTGVITYSAEFDDRPLASISGAISESVTINDTAPADVFASLPVLGRAAGPVLQSIGTYTSSRRSIVIEAVTPVASLSYTPAQPNTDALVLSLLPPGTQVFKEQDEVSWSARNGRYSRNVAFTWQ